MSYNRTIFDITFQKSSVISMFASGTDFAIRVRYEGEDDEDKNSKYTDFRQMGQDISVVDPIDVDPEHADALW